MPVERLLLRRGNLGAGFGFLFQRPAKAKKNALRFPLRFVLGFGGRLRRLTRLLRWDFGAFVSCLLLFVACTKGESQFYDIQVTEEREPCSDTNPLRNAYFGDTHVHTSYSFDAFTQDVRTTPDDAYAFAQGASVLLPPLDENGVGTVAVELDRTLDFVAVTDHAEFFGEVQVCIDPDSPGYDSAECESLRAGSNGGTFQFGFALVDERPERWDLCGENGEDCADKAKGVWWISLECILYV